MCGSTQGLDVITNLLEDIVIIGYRDAYHDGQLVSLLNTLSTRDPTLTYENCEFGFADLHFAGFTNDQTATVPCTRTWMPC